MLRDTVGLCRVNRFVMICIVQGVISSTFFLINSNVPNFGNELHIQFKYCVYIIQRCLIVLDPNSVGSKCSDTSHMNYSVLFFWVAIYYAIVFNNSFSLLNSIEPMFGIEPHTQLMCCEICC